METKKLVPVLFVMALLIQGCGGIEYVIPEENSEDSSSVSLPSSGGAPSSGGTTTSTGGTAGAPGLPGTGGGGGGGGGGGTAGTAGTGGSVTSSANGTTLSASPGSISAGQTTVLTWQTPALGACSPSSNWNGGNTVSGSIQVSPTVTTTYSLMCTGLPNLFWTVSVTVTVN